MGLWPKLKDQSLKGGGPCLEVQASYNQAIKGIIEELLWDVIIGP